MQAFAAGMGNDDVTTKYQRERMVEMAFEGQRFWDVRRWKIGDTQRTVMRMNITLRGEELEFARVASNRYWNDKMYLFPIPDAEMRINSNLTQNPGW